MEDADVHACLRSRRERLPERSAYGVGPDDVVLEQDFRFGVLDQLEHRGEGVGAISQQSHAIRACEGTAGQPGSAAPGAGDRAVRWGRDVPETRPPRTGSPSAVHKRARDRGRTSGSTASEAPGRGRRDPRVDSVRSGSTRRRTAPIDERPLALHPRRTGAQVRDKCGDSSASFGFVRCSTTSPNRGR